MQHLNKQSTEIFKALMEKLDEQEYIKIENDPYMVLSFEAIGKIRTKIGEGRLYSLMHHYTQEGDLMRDPEVCFIEIKVNNETEIFPYSYQLDGLGIYQESMFFNENGEIEVNQNLQSKHTSFANDWLTTIKSQNYLK